MNNRIAVQSLWIGELTQLEILSINSFIKNGIDFIFYTYDTDPINLPDGTIVKDANDIMPKQDIFKLKESYLPFSDIWRFKLLHDKGGIWVDLDMICLRAFDKEITDAEYIFGSERTIQKGAYRLDEPTVMNINFLKAPQGSLFYKELYDKCIKYQSKNGARENIKYMRMARDLIKKYNYEKYIKPYYYFNGIDWWNAKEIYMHMPYGLKDKYGVCPCYRWEKEGYTLHCWRSILKKRKVDLNSFECIRESSESQDYHEDSIISRLLNRYKL